ncbi:hypothetical protein CRV02_01350 [Arcobacter sp. CECT 8989]|uniref:diguanylate cyclase n=1 Tax=Arcobacter sp. CECT 8989 TaxID=2044509 RepID=UPI00100AB7BD|nr:transporter substrate-binding domain-containing protein [Arcobacter sp. CECT 8989]RXK03866.1 hypothetical protein CRV02_01350 [Arcobacter sp. CECT 8989]
MIKIVFLVFFISNILFANEKVNLQLKWFHQFQFAGYYAAKEKGFYSDLGLDVEIKERDLKYNNIEQVINGEANYGVADSVLMLYKAKKEPVVIVSPIFQHSPNILISLKESRINSLFDLEDKELLFYSNDTDGLSILSMLKNFEIKNIKLTREREKKDYLKLINSETDLMVGYISNEPFYFLEKGIDINIINPAHYGFDLYGDMLFTSEKEALNHPDRVKKFKEASLKGWHYALSNKEEIINLIYNKYTKRKSLKHLRYEANAIEKMISKDIIPLGTFDKGRIKYITDLYKKQNLLNEIPNIKNFIFEDFISDINSKLTKEEKDYLSEKKVLKVANLKSFPPYNYNINGKPKGYIIDYFNLLAMSLNLKVEFITKPWNELIEMLHKKEIDLIPHIAINEERLKYVDFTSFTPIVYQSAIAVPNNSSIKSLKDLSEKKLSILDNSFLEPIIRKEFPSIQLITTKTIEDAVKLVSERKVDAVIDELTILEYHINNKWISNVKTFKIDGLDNIPSITPLYVGVKKDNILLKSILEKANTSISDNNIISLKKKWLDKAYINSIDFSRSEYEYLKRKNKINYCLNDNRMPIEKIKDNQLIGISSEFIKIFEKNTDLKFNIINSKNIHDFNKSCDVISLMIKQRNSPYLFSKKFLSFPLAIATKSDEPYISSFKTLNNRVIGYVKNSIDIDSLKLKYPQVKFKEVSSSDLALTLISNNKLYGLLGTLPELGYQVQKNHELDFKVSANLNEIVEYSLAIKKDNTSLLGIINKVLKSIPKDERENIYNKWNTVKYERNIDIKKLLIGVFIILIIILIVIYKNRQIKVINNKMKRYIKIVDEHVLTSTTDLEGNITYASKAFCKISGYKKEEILGKNHNIVRHEDMPDSLFKEMWDTIKSGKRWNGEIKNKKKDGTFYWVEINVEPVLNTSNKIDSFMSVRHDISDKKKIEKISITDELTGLYNRRYFNQILHQELNRAKRDNYAFALIIFDVDFFKQYNDNYGHQKGDHVLSSIGKELKTICKRSTDFTFRIGGEEFAVIFKPHSKENAIKFASILNKRIENLNIEHSFSKVSKYITVSVGLYSDIGNNLSDEESVYNFADLALYEAKEKGRNQVILYSTGT